MAGLRGLGGWVDGVPQRVARGDGDGMCGLGRRGTLEGGSGVGAGAEGFRTPYYIWGRGAGTILCFRISVFLVELRGNNPIKSWRVQKSSTY